MAKCVCQLSLSLPFPSPLSLSCCVCETVHELIDDKYSMCPQWPLEIKRLNVRHIKWYNMKSEKWKRWRPRHRLRCPRNRSQALSSILLLLCYVMPGYSPRRRIVINDHLRGLLQHVPLYPVLLPVIWSPSFLALLSLSTFGIVCKR